MCSLTLIGARSGLIGDQGRLLIRAYTQTDNPASPILTAKTVNNIYLFGFAMPQCLGKMDVGLTLPYFISGRTSNNSFFIGTERLL